MLSWPGPDELPYAFVHERSHFPGPTRELDFDLNIKAMEWGFNEALIQYGLALRVADREDGWILMTARRPAANAVA